MSSVEELLGEISFFVIKNRYKKKIQKGAGITPSLHHLLASSIMSIFSIIVKADIPAFCIPEVSTSLCTGSSLTFSCLSRKDLQLVLWNGIYQGCEQCLHVELQSVSALLLGQGSMDRQRCAVRDACG